MKVAVSGASGFIGWHLRARLLREPDIDVVPLSHGEFEDAQKMRTALAAADAVVHLAGGRFSQNDDEDYAANMALTNAVLAGLRASEKKIPLFFASSKSIEKDTGYGRSKKDGSALAKAWGEESGSPVRILIMPNVIGEFAQPDHHTAVATFCRDIAEGKESTVNGDGEVELLHAQDAADDIVRFLRTPTSSEERVEGVKYNVKALYDLLKGFHASYIAGIFPALATPMEHHLFAMIYSYAFEGLIPRPLTPKSDERGTLVEFSRTLSSGQSFTSTSVPGAVRGDHYHIRKIERFCVVKGSGVIRLRKLLNDRVLEYPVSGDTPVYIDMPTFYTHHVENTGQQELMIAFWTDELYDPEDPDTYPEKVR